MKKKQQARQSNSFKLTKKSAIIYGSIGAVVAAIAIAAYFSSVPVNSSVPVFGFANNHFIKASVTSSGYVWISASSGSVKGMRGSNGAGVENPTYLFNKGELESLHITNEDEQTHSAHNFNIDEFNVHSRNLNAFGSESQTINFIADKAGTFHYYCSLHPEMKGDIVIQ
jgi:plastocyanin